MIIKNQYCKNEINFWAEALQIFYFEMFTNKYNNIVGAYNIRILYYYQNLTVYAYS